MNGKLKPTHDQPGGFVDEKANRDDGVVNDSLGTVNIADSTGLALDGNADGTPGGAFTTLVRRLALGRPVAATIPVVSKMVPSGPVSARRSRLPLK